jgi:hypothetical protein
MRLLVSNLGPIREAEIDLEQPLMVLAGPNNSGKTYLAWLTYSLGSLPSAIEDYAELSLVNARAIVEQAFATGDPTIDLNEMLSLQYGLFGVAQNYITRQLPSVFAAPAEQFANTLIGLHPSDEDARRYLSRSERHNVLVVSKRGATWAIRHDFDGPVVRLQLKRLGGSDPPGEPFERVMPEEEQREAANGAAKHMLGDLLRVLLGHRMFPLPVERIAINLFARELAANRTALVDELLETMSEADGEAVGEALQQKARPYPKAIRDALQHALRMAQPPNTPSSFADLADELERAVVGGTLKVGAHSRIHFSPHNASSGLALELHQSASVVKSLVGLVFYLRYEARVNDWIIIDEPELNLHPDNQRRIARIFAKAVNRGLRIMMSTHSDYVIRELNNLIMLGQDTDASREVARQLGYGPDEKLSPTQVGAYLVVNGGCDKLSVTETGFEVETIEREIHKLNQDAQAIYLRLFADE